MDKFDHIKRSTTSDDQSGSSQIRSYTCTFCRRGFSNAQALGGHMNIHRRDRARIRQFSEEHQLSNSDTSKSTAPIDPTNFAFEENTSLQLEFLSEQKSGITKSSYNSFNSREDVKAIHRGKVAVDDDHQEIQKLPLFVEEPTTNDNNYKSEEKRAEKLDLELRLGPDPDHDKSRLSTQEFY